MEREKVAGPIRVRHNRLNEKSLIVGLGIVLLMLLLVFRIINMTVIESNPYKIHGALSVKGSQLVDSNGKPFQLKGVSTDGVGKYPQYVNRRAFKTLRDKWGVNVIRLALYTEEYNGYLSGGDQKELESVIDHGVRYCSDLGMYCIIDWHILSDYNPNMHRQEAADFFKKMSLRYKDRDNVLYEICNEPSHGTSWRQVKSYAEYILEELRQNSPDAIVLIGTPEWCQDVDLAAEDPLTDYKNIMYTCHFYAATHKEEERAKLNRALDMDCPVFISEFGICGHKRDGTLDKKSAEEWKKIIRAHGLSFCAWNLSNKKEDFALIKPNVNKLSGWHTWDLTASGKWVLNMIKYPW